MTDHYSELRSGNGRSPEGRTVPAPEQIGAGTPPIHPLEMSAAKIALFKVMQASLDMTKVGHELSRFIIEGEDSRSFAFGEDVTIHLVSALLAVLEIERPRLRQSAWSVESDVASTDALAAALVQFQKEWARG